MNMLAICGFFHSVKGKLNGERGSFDYEQETDAGGDRRFSYDGTDYVPDPFAGRMYYLFTISGRYSELGCRLAR
jgi:hypothetical protein